MKTRTIYAAGLLALLALACVGASQPQQEDTQDTVTLQAAMASVGTADVGLFGHSVYARRAGHPAVRPGPAGRRVGRGRIRRAAACDMAHGRSVHGARATRWRRADHPRPALDRSCRLRGLRKNEHRRLDTARCAQGQDGNYMNTRLPTSAELMADDRAAIDRAIRPLPTIRVQHGMFGGGVHPQIPVTVMHLDFSLPKGHHVIGGQLYRETFDPDELQRITYADGTHPTACALIPVA